MRACKDCAHTRICYEGQEASDETDPPNSTGADGGDVLTALPCPEGLSQCGRCEQEGSRLRRWHGKETCAAHVSVPGHEKQSNGASSKKDISDGSSGKLLARSQNLNNCHSCLRKDHGHNAC